MPARITHCGIMVLAIAAPVATLPAASEPQDPLQNTLSSSEADIAILTTAAAEFQRTGQVERAIEALSQLVSVLGTVHGNDAGQLIEPLLQLGDLQFAHNDLAAAATSLERAISIISTTDDVFSFRLVEPLSTLADIYNRLGQSELAVELLRRARHITHRRLGILNLEQLDLAEQLSESYFRLGQIGEANREHRFAFRVNERRYGPDSPELVPALYTLGQWYERIGMYSVARRNYRRAADLLSEHYGPDDLRVADPLRRLARTYLMQDEPLREGQLALKQAIDIYASDPGADVADHAASLVELGDWMMLARRREQALAVYAQAWNLITDNGAQPEKAEPLLGRPKRLRFNPPLADESIMRGQPQVYLDVRFTVSPEGVARDVEVIGGSAHWQMRRDFRSAVHKARFRPRFEDGQPVITEDIVFRYTYQMRGQDQPAAPAPPSVDRAGDEEVP